MSNMYLYSLVVHSGGPTKPTEKKPVGSEKQEYCKHNYGNCLQCGFTKSFAWNFNSMLLLLGAWGAPEMQGISVCDVGSSSNNAMTLLSAERTFQHSRHSIAYTSV